jgi:hypothetical protein
MSDWKSSVTTATKGKLKTHAIRNIITMDEYAGGKADFVNLMFIIIIIIRVH